MHVFPYSVRKGTVAAKMKQVGGETIRSRAAKLRELADELRAAHLEEKVGETVEVLFENEENGLSVGYTRAYEKVYAAAPTGRILKVKITSPFGEGLKGEVLRTTAFSVRSARAKSRRRSFMRTKICSSSRTSTPKPKSITL